MSVVTSVLLTTGFGSNHDAIATMERSIAGLKLRDISEVDAAYSGGGKAPQFSAYVFAFNQWNPIPFLQAIRSAPWEDKESVQLFIHGENSIRLIEVNPFHERAEIVIRSAMEAVDY